MIRIVLISEAMLGGIRQHVFDIARGLDKTKYDVYLIYSDLRADDKFYEEIESVGKQVKLFKCNEMHRELGVSDYGAYRRIKEILIEIKPDIVHCHSSKAGMVGRLAAKRCKVPTIIYTPNAYAFQGTDLTKFKRQIYILAEKYLSRFASTYTINVSKGELNEALNNKLDKVDKFILIYNGIPESEMLNRDELKEKIGLSSNINYVGFTGRCAKQKDPFSFLVIAEKIIKYRNDVEFVYIGDGDLEDDMRRWISDRKLSDKIHMLGFRSDSAEVVGAFDIYLSTALYEGLPYSMIEAMRAGVPIIATDCIGNNELVFEGINGNLYPIGDIDSAVKRLLDQIENKKITNEKVRETFSNNFSLECMLDELSKVYSSCKVR